jgi:hypothetical protein
MLKVPRGQPISGWQIGCLLRLQSTSGKNSRFVIESKFARLIAGTEQAHMNGGLTKVPYTIFPYTLLPLTVHTGG